MFTPRLIGACAAAAAAVAIVAAISINTTAPSSAASRMPRALGSTDIGVPIAYDVKEPRRHEDSSVPSASGLPLQDAVSEPVPTF